MDRNLKVFLNRLFEPYLERGIERWFYIFGMNDTENNFVHIFSPFEYHKKYRGKSGKTDYIHYLRTLDDVEEKIRRAFATNWYVSPAYFTAELYRMDFFGGTIWTYVDIDFKHYIDVNDVRKTKAFAGELAEKIIKTCDPDMMVFSGGGLHVYKQLDKIISDKNEWKKEERKLADCVKMVGVEPDPVVSNNIINILRIPGTINLRYKDGNKHRFVDLIYKK